MPAPGGAFGMMQPRRQFAGTTPRPALDLRDILAVLANVPTAMGGEGPVIGCGMAYARKPRKGKVRITAPDPGRCYRENLRVHSRARIFRARKRCREYATDREAVRTQEEVSPPAAICPSMTGSPRASLRHWLKESVMGIIAWIILGLAAGLLANMLIPGKRSQGLILTCLIGIAGGTARRLACHQAVSHPQPARILQPLHLDHRDHRRSDPATRLPPDHQPVRSVPPLRAPIRHARQADQAMDLARLRHGHDRARW